MTDPYMDLRTSHPELFDAEWLHAWLYTYCRHRAKAQRRPVWSVLGELIGVGSNTASVITAHYGAYADDK